MTLHQVTAMAGDTSQQACAIEHGDYTVTCWRLHRAQVDRGDRLHALLFQTADSIRALIDQARGADVQAFDAMAAQLATLRARADLLHSAIGDAAGVAESLHAQYLASRAGELLFVINNEPGSALADDARRELARHDDVARILQRMGQLQPIGLTDLTIFAASAPAIGIAAQALAREKAARDYALALVQDAAAPWTMGNKPGGAQ